MKKRKGWRKGKARDGRYQMRPSYRHQTLDLCVALCPAGRWYFYGSGHNSLCEQPPRKWPDAGDAMVAAEAFASGGAS